jgi:hypothetical protein
VLSMSNQRGRSRRSAEAAVYADLHKTRYRDAIIGMDCPPDRICGGHDCAPSGSEEHWQATQRPKGKRPVIDQPKTISVSRFAKWRLGSTNRNRTRVLKPENLSPPQKDNSTAKTTSLSNQSDRINPRLGKFWGTGEQGQVRSTGQMKYARISIRLETPRAAPLPDKIRG